VRSESERGVEFSLMNATCARRMPTRVYAIASSRTYSQSSDGRHATPILRRTGLSRQARAAMLASVILEPVGEAVYHTLRTRLGGRWLRLRAGAAGHVGRPSSPGGAWRHPVLAYAALRGRARGRRRMAWMQPRRLRACAREDHPLCHCPPTWPARGALRWRCYLLA
jgi:hypothetical protein